ncbi:MAG: hypothetical protein DRJ50_15365 [Actinobacteria bacterium]|nr:MAG: hypothetical protein DRJ50_15365 [Actinomycetota bacterium]
MKPLAIWVAIVVVVFGGFALITSSLRDTTQVFVAVDSSFEMGPVWRRVQRELDRIDDSDHSEFALATARSLQSDLIHSWQPELTLVGIEPFAPCSFDGIGDYVEATEADKRILITTSARGCDTTALGDWEIIQLGP